jgi:predicted transcriptional regulator
MTQRNTNTQEQMAREAKVEQTTVQLIVRECAEISLVDGQSTGNFDTFNKIQKHFGVKE